MGCAKVSPGCAHCYAEALVTNRMGLTVWGKDGTRKETSEKYWREPIKWNAAAEDAGTPELVFCGSLCDVMEDHPIANLVRPRLFELIKKTPWLTWQLLTKRPENFERFLPAGWYDLPWPNVWLGTSIENPEFLWRADVLRKIPAFSHFISAEPLLASIIEIDLSNIQWLIVGGESGKGYRPMAPGWAVELRDKCKGNGVPFFYKQSAAIKPGSNDLLEGKEYKEFPFIWQPGQQEKLCFTL